MLELIRFKINRLNEAKAWVLTNANATKEAFIAKFKDVDDMLNEVKQVEVKPAEVQSIQYVKQQPTSSFVSFN